MNPEKAYAELITLSRERSVLGSTLGILQWDAEIIMPRDGLKHRGDQMAMLAGIVHDRGTNPRIGELLSEIEGTPLVSDPDSVEAVNVRELRRDFDRETKLPRELVEELSRVHAHSQQAWSEARDKDQFKLFQPWLDRTFTLAREKADAMGYEDVRYDALLDDYEPLMTTAKVSALFAELGPQLIPIVDSLRDRPTPELHKEFPVERQRAFAEEIAESVGFDAAGGRFDLGPHPFCSTIGPGDVRIASRYDARNFANGFLGVMHEAGHALYEQGIDPAHYGTPMGEAVSLGVHESQSRTWENLVARTNGFWQHVFPRLERSFKSELEGVSLEGFRKSLNHVAPGPIRVEADEVTYNLHILIRFELERALLDGDLKAADLPGAWTERYQHYLGITPDSDATGCLQDIHWSEGLIGYFPTYTLGNVYAAQLFEAAEKAVGPLEESFAAGEFGPLREWLRENVHRHGRRYAAARLIERVTGSAPNPAPMVASLLHRYG
ncbi:MAG TPA: carboxypeptidase M32 [Gemmatimonadaceae bacterium]|nr:carboxypeptidase M32 [Gemmatimonadaceae bacterium]